MTNTDTRGAADLPKQLLINGRWQAGSAGTFIDRNPATGQPLAEIAAAPAGGVDPAVTAARAQLEGGWGTTPGSERAKILYRTAELIERDAELLARYEALDVGK